MRWIAVTAAVLWLQLLVAKGPLCLAQQQQEPSPLLDFNVTDGQQFADACAAFGRRNADTTISLPANTTISLASSSFSNVTDAEAVGGKAFSAGVLTIQGQGSDGSVLDAGMRAGLIPPTGRMVVFQDLSLVNLCAVVNVRGPGLAITVQTLLGLVGATTVSRSLAYRNVVLYVRPGEVHFQMYTLGMPRLPWSLVRQRYARQGGTFTNMGPVIKRTSASSLTLGSITASSLTSQVMTWQSTADLSNPLVRSMRQTGTLLPLRWCGNQSLVPAEVAETPYELFWGPLWAADDADQVLGALAEASVAAARHAAAQLPVPAVLINAPCVNLSSASTPNTFQLSAALQLWGPFNDDSSDLMPVPGLDLANRTTPLFNLSGAGQLFITRLILDGLAAPQTAPAQTSLSTAPALALAGLAGSSSSSSSSGATLAASTDAPIQLHNVTVVLPVQDYLALLTLATDGVSGMGVRGCMDREALQLAAQLSSNVFQLSLAPAAQRQSFNALWQALPLSTYTGWGVNATQLLLHPSEPVPAQIAATCVPSTVSSSTNRDDDGLSSGARAGIIVGCTVGGVLLLAGLAAAALLLHRRHKRQAAVKTPGSSALKCSSPEPADVQSSNDSTCIDVSSADRDSTAANADAAPAAAAAAPSSRAAHCEPGSPAFSQGAVPPAVVSQLHAEERRLLAQFDPQAACAAPHAAATSPAPASAATVAAARLAATAAAAAAAAPTTGITPARVPPPPHDAASGSPGSSSLLSRAHEVLMSHLGSKAQGRAAPPSQRVHLDVDLPVDSSSSRSACIGTASQAPSPPADGSGDATVSASLDTGCSLSEQAGTDTKQACSGKVVALAADAGGEGLLGEGAGGEARSSHGARPSRGSSVGHLIDQVQRARERVGRDGDEADKVVIHGLLGMGGCGTVYLGEWRSLPVAVKTMVYEVNAGQDGTRAVMETAISASVGHKNLVATYHYDVKRVCEQVPLLQAAFDAVQASRCDSLKTADALEGTARDPPRPSSGGTFKVFLIQELCQGSMAEMLRRDVMHDPNLPAQHQQAFVCTLLLHVASGLDYLHGLCIIHGDLTPGNVLLKLDPRAPFGVIAKLADFGLSRRLDQQATHVSNFNAGTPFYVAPEVVFDRRTSLASDIYSFGVLMWQLLTHDKPYIKQEDGTCTPNPFFPTITSAHGTVPAALQRLLRSAIPARGPRRATSRRSSPLKSLSWASSRPPESVQRCWTSPDDGRHQVACRRIHVCPKRCGPA